MSEQEPNTPEAETEPTEQEAAGQAGTAPDNVNNEGGEGEAAAEAEAAAAGDDAGEDPLTALEAQVADLNDKLLRALAETENVRRRAERDKQDASKYAIAGFAREMLGVADNLRRAIDAVDADTRKADEAVANVLAGVEMTEREMLAAFERSGIQRLDPLGQRFDSNLHEAMFEIPDESQPAGTIAQVVETGYMLNDRLLRPAKVGITKGGPKPDLAPAPENTGEAAGGDGQKAYEQDAEPTGGQVNEEL